MKADLNLLVVFDAILRKGSVSGAAQHLSLSQPAVSHALARLRRQLGDPLFVRAGRGLTPSDHARALAPRIRDLIQAAEALIQPEAFRPETFDGRYRLAASDFAALSLVPPLLAQLRAASPAAQVQVFPVDGDTVRRVELGEIDFSFWGTTPLEEPFRFTPLFHESFLGVADQAHPIFGLPAGKEPNLDTVLSFRHAVISLGDPGRSPVDAALHQLGRSRQVGLIAPGFASSMAALPGSELVACIPSRLRAVLPAGLRCFTLPFAVPAFAYGLLWHDNSGRQPRQAWLRSRVADLFAPGAKGAAALG